MYSYCRASSRSSSSIAPRVGAARPVEVIGAGKDFEAGLVLHHELAQELAVEPVQVVDRVDEAVARPDAEEQRDLAEPRLQVDDDRRALVSRASSTPQFTAIVVVPAPPLAPKNTSVVAAGLAPGRGLAARGRPPDGAVKRVLGAAAR